MFLKKIAANHLPKAIAWAAFLALLVVNAWIIQHRSEGYTYQHFATYDELYVASEMLFVKKIELANDTGTIFLSQQLPGSWQLSIDDTMAGSVSSKQAQLTFTMPAGVHRYRFVNMAAAKIREFECIIDNACADVAAKNCLNELRYLSLPMPYGSVYPLSFWSNSHAFSAHDVASGRQLLSMQDTAGKSMQPIPAMARLTGAMRVSNLASEWQPSMGNTISPDSMVKYVISQQTGLNCGNFSFIVHYLATSAGLANRSVQFADDGTNWSYGVHYFNEIFIPEKNSWAMVDALHNVWLPQDSSGRLLNTADILRLLQSGSTLQEYIAYRFHNDSLVAMPLSFWNPTWQLYFANPNSTLSYWPANSQFKNDVWSRLNRLYGFDKSKFLWSDRYRNHPQKIAFKIVMLLGLLLSCMYLVAFYWPKRRMHTPREQGRS